MSNKSTATNWQPAYDDMIRSLESATTYDAAMDSLMLLRGFSEGLLSVKAVSPRKFAAMNDFTTFIGNEVFAKIEQAMSAAIEPDQATTFSLKDHLERQHVFSQKTFGPGYRLESVVEHIRKELNEVLQNPNDAMEWIDIVLLAFDGALRSGSSSDSIIKALKDKLTINENRIWPDWKTVSDNQVIEHVKSDQKHIADRLFEAQGASHITKLAGQNDQVKTKQQPDITDPVTVPKDLLMDAIAVCKRHGNDAVGMTLMTYIIIAEEGQQS